MIRIEDKEEFFYLQNKIDYIPFSQSYGWLNYVNKSNESIHYYVNSKQNCKIALWGRVKNIPIIGKVFYSEGEAINDVISEKEITKFYTGLTNVGYSIIYLNSNNKYMINYEIGIRRSGYLRPLVSRSCPLSIEIDLSNRNYDTNWKKNIEKAINNNLVFYESKNIKEDADKFVKLHSELVRYKKLNYVLNNTSIQELIASRDMRLFFVATKDNIVLSGRIVYVNKHYSADVFAANSILARDYSSSFLIMDRVFSYLHNEGVRNFEFSRIPPSRNTTDSVYIFKNGSRGNRLQYNGEWVWSKNKSYEIMHTIIQALLKRNRY